MALVAVFAGVLALVGALIGWSFRKPAAGAAFGVVVGVFVGNWWVLIAVGTGFEAEET